MIAAGEQSATGSFFLAVVLAWASALLGMEVLRRLRPSVWPCEAPPRSDRPRLDLVLALLASAAVIALGALWQWSGLLGLVSGAMRHVVFAVSQLAIWSPIPIVMWLRRQRASSAWTGAAHLGERLIAGIALGVLAVAVYLAMRGDLDRLPVIARRAGDARTLAHAVPIYLEGVGLAFLFVRLEWALGRLPARLLPALLFALAHVSRAIHDGKSAGTIAAFFAFDTVFIALLLALLTRYRDMVSLGVVHLCMDLATEAF